MMLIISPSPSAEQPLDSQLEDEDDDDKPVRPTRAVGALSGDDDDDEYKLLTPSDPPQTPF
jgi:hypothetical protein